MALQMKTARKRVAKGVELLDERVPNWRKVVRPDLTDISYSNSCVLGQVFGDYKRGEMVLGLKRADAVRLGFWVRGSNEEGEKRDFSVLTKAWQEAMLPELAA